MKVRLNQIRLDGGTQSRVKMSKDKIAEYAESMMEGKVFPPVLVYNDGVYHWLADGFHRYHAVKNTKADSIECEVIKGNQRDAFLYSLKANRDHGMPSSREDKANAVIRALQDEILGKESSRYIAKVCDLSHTFVDKIRKEYEASLKEPAKPAKAEKATPKDKPKEEKPSAVENLVPSKEYETAHEDEVAELASQTNELVKELEQVKTELAIVQMDDLTEAQQEVKETIISLRERVAELEAEVAGLKNSRNHLQHENTELKKTLAYWKRQASKVS